MEYYAVFAQEKIKKPACFTINKQVLGRCKSMMQLDDVLIRFVKNVAVRDEPRKCGFLPYQWAMPNRRQFLDI